MTRAHRGLFLFVVLPFCVLGLGLGRSNADASRMLAVAMACPGGLPGPDCSRGTALDVLAQPATATDCPKVALLLAVHLSLPAGGYHKLACERRKS